MYDDESNAPRFVPLAGSGNILVNFQCDETNLNYHLGAWRPFKGHLACSNYECISFIAQHGK